MKVKLLPKLKPAYDKAVPVMTQILGRLKRVRNWTRQSRVQKADEQAFRATWQEDAYLKLYPDVRRAVEDGALTSGFAHWLTVGRSEGRVNPGDEGLPSVEKWDEAGYLYLYPDVEKAVEAGGIASGYAHYVTLGKKESRRLPSPFGPAWLVDEMREISSIEHMLHPSPRFFATASDFSAHKVRPLGTCICNSLKQIKGRQYSHVFILPWLRRGGADLGALHHIHALTSLGFEHILVITTELTPSTWLFRLPPNVTHLDLGSINKPLPALDDQVLVLTRVLLAVQGCTIHIINSNLGWQTVEAYGDAIRQNSRIFASVFCYDYDKDMRVAGYTENLILAWDKLELVFTDNEAIVRSLVDTCAYPKDLFFVLPFPAEAQTPFPVSHFTAERRPQILWAGRLDRQKRPDILRDIAAQMPSVDFVVYGAGMLDVGRVDEVLEDLKRLPNVDLRGNFDGFNSIPREDYRLFLYTSAWDGVPNIILEAFSSGLPVVAPAIGGIEEVYPEESTFLVYDCQNAAGYVDALNILLQDPAHCYAERERVKRYCREIRSFERFCDRLRKLPSYTGAQTLVAPEKAASSTRNVGETRGLRESIQT